MDNSFERKSQILLVEDEAMIAQVQQAYLQNAGFLVHWFFNQIAHIRAGHLAERECAYHQRHGLVARVTANPRDNGHEKREYDDVRDGIFKA